MNGWGFPIGSWFERMVKVLGALSNKAEVRIFVEHHLNLSHLQRKYNESDLRREMIEPVSGITFENT